MTPKSLEKTPIDWSALLAGLILLTVAILIAVGVIVASQLYLTYQNNYERQQRQSLGGIEQRITQIQEAIDIVNNLYYAEYQKLVQTGFFQQNQQSNIEQLYLDIVKKVKEIASASKPKLPSVSVELSEQKPFNIPHISSMDLQTYQLPLTLKLGLLHEGDLLGLLHDIEYNDKYTGLYTLRHCDIERKVAEINVQDASQIYFTAACHFEWYIAYLKILESSL